MDYSSECTDEFLADGTCFTCEDCNNGSGTDYIIPTVFADPTACATTETVDAHYVNMGVDPCFFDAQIADIQLVDTCATVEGGDVDISAVIPWYASWGIPQMINFSAVEDNMAWTINDGDDGTTQYFVQIDSDWLYAGIKDTTNNEFFFLGTGSPAYYVSNGEDAGININAYAGPYAGPITSDTSEFEAMQVRDQGDNTYMSRMKSNGTYLWYAEWSSTDDTVPMTPAEVAAKKNVPSENRCVLIGDSVSTSKYVPLAECVTSFEVADTTALNNDDLYILKVFDIETLNLIDFSTALTADVAATCISEGGEE